MDEKIILYSTGCSKCGILKKKLDTIKAPYIENHDADEMQRLGMTEAPGLMVDGQLMNFAQAIHWVNAHANDFSQKE